MNEENQENGAGGRVWLDAVMLGLWLILGMIACFGLTVVVPKYAEQYVQLGVDLPATTRALLWAGSTFAAWWYLLIPLVLLLSAIPIAVRPGRSWPVYIVCAMLALALIAGGVLFVHLPLVKIQQIMSKRR